MHCLTFRYAWTADTEVCMCELQVSVSINYMRRTRCHQHFNTWWQWAQQQGGFCSMHTCEYMDMHAYVHTHKQLNRLTYRRTETNAHVHKLSLPPTHTHTPPHTHTYTLPSLSLHTHKQLLPWTLYADNFSLSHWFPWEEEAACVDTTPPCRTSSAQSTES